MHINLLEKHLSLFRLWLMAGSFLYFIPAAKLRKKAEDSK